MRISEKLWDAIRVEASDHDVILIPKYSIKNKKGIAIKGKSKNVEMFLFDLVKNTHKSLEEELKNLLSAREDCVKDEEIDVWFPNYIF